MVKLTLYHGTSAANARKIMSNGFVPDTKYNWKIKRGNGPRRNAPKIRRSRLLKRRSH